MNILINPQGDINVLVAVACQNPKLVTFVPPQRLKRYELFGWDYDRYRELSEQEINWYEKFARRTGGPVLGLACQK
ncbi:MAG: hypothetical protein ACE5PV_10230 [Candidatus Poribacteria bacterium]